MLRKSLHPWARYRRAAGFTQQEIADLLKVSRHYVIRLEQSLFTSPPRDILVKLADLYGIALDIFETSYYSYVRLTREEFAEGYGKFETFFTDPYQFAKHPLVFYRDSYELSRMGLCKALCLHYDPIFEYEHNKQREVPDQLKEACEEIGWDVKPLRRAVADWRSSGRADQTRRIYR